MVKAQIQRHLRKLYGSLAYYLILFKKYRPAKANKICQRFPRPIGRTPDPGPFCQHKRYAAALCIFLQGLFIGLALNNISIYIISYPILSLVGWMNRCPLLLAVNKKWFLLQIWQRFPNSFVLVKSNFVTIRPVYSQSLKSATHLWSVYNQSRRH